VAKRKKVRIETSEPEKPFNPAFAALADLRSEMPDTQDVPPPPGPEPPARGPRGKIVVTREKKGRGGKTVTRVAQLRLDAAALAGLVDTLKRSLGCAGHIEDEDLILAGDQTARAAEWLGAELGRKVVVGN
jgi:translation initiation factor 1